MAKLKEKPQPLTAGDLRPGGNAMGMLLSYVERFERLTEEIDALGDDRKEVMSEAKAIGFDTAILRKVIARRRMDTASRQEADAILDLYEETLNEAEKRQKEKSVADGAPITRNQQIDAQKTPAAEPAPKKFTFRKPVQTDVEDLAP